MKNTGIRFITITAVLIALLVVIQLVTSPMGQLVTGSAVNLLLVLASLTAGVASGLTVAVVSPFIAFFFGIGKFIQFVPVIAVANAVLVLTYFVINKKIFVGKCENIKWIFSVAAAALLKYSVFKVFSGLILPLLNLPEQMLKAASTMFSVNQLITACIGGVIAIIAYPLVKKAISHS